MKSLKKFLPYLLIVVAIVVFKELGIFELLKSAKGDK